MIKKWIVHIKEEGGTLEFDYFQCSACLAHSKARAKCCPVCGVPLDLDRAEVRISMEFKDIPRIKYAK